MKRKVEAQLIAWKNKSSERQPLLVNGARQVGKTYILRKFGEEQFKNVVYVNLETNLTIASYFNDNIAPERLLRYLEASTGERIIAGETLIFFDEIQSCERALTSLKYFCEETPEFHIAAAGSLLGVAFWLQSLWIIHSITSLPSTEALPPLSSTTKMISILSACILWILRNTYGLVVRSSLLLKYVPPLKR